MKKVSSPKGKGKEKDMPKGMMGKLAMLAHSASGDKKAHAKRKGK